MAEVPAPAKQYDSVTVFSNGQAHMRTHRTVKSGKEGQDFTLPFKASSMEDVLASFAVFGGVAYTKPASFTQPTKKSSLQLEGSTFSSLAGLRGTKVKFLYGAKTVEGTLFGTDTNDEATASGGTIEKRFITVMTKDGIETLPWAEVTKFEFTEPEIKAEVDKALSASRQKLKPDAVFLNVGLKSKNDQTDATAMFQWVEQLNPWSLSYRFSKADAGGYKLDVFGILHNGTDVDWNDTIFTFVTGKPLTFISDLDKQRAVSRTQINVQDTVSRGGHIAEDGIPMSLMQDAAGSDNLESVQVGAKMRAGLRSAMPAAAPQMAGMMGGAEAFTASNFGGSQFASQKAAPIATVTTEEVGDFCVYKQDTPLSIPANTTATMPLFSRDLKDAKPVLVFDPRKNATRPFRAISFTNDTGETLGMGVAVVFEKNLFQGKCILNASKPGEKRMLYYAEETGVAIKTTTKRNDDNRERLIIAAGVGTARSWQSMTTTYILRNVKDEQFTILLDYQKGLAPTSECVCTAGKESIKATEELAAGLRYSITLPAKGTITVTITEKYLASEEFEITSNVNWFIQAYISGNTAITSDKKVKAAIAAKDAVDKKNAEIAACNAKIAKANQQKANMTQVLGLGANAGNLAEYQADLKTAINTLKEEGTTLEKLSGELQGLNDKMYEAINKMAGEWAYEQTQAKPEAE